MVARTAVQMARSPLNRLESTCASADGVTATIDRDAADGAGVEVRRRRRGFVISGVGDGSLTSRTAG
jgi:hypothetical protein